MVMRAVLAMAAMVVAAEAGAADGAARVEYGRYLVEGVGLCEDCHTPHDAGGRPDASRRLQGAAIPFAPTVPMPAWAEAAPPIAGGRAGWTRTQLVEFLVTGVNPGGRPARPPMPPYRLNRPDAEAVAAYLESLPPDAPLATTASDR